MEVNAPFDGAQLTREVYSSSFPGNGARKLAASRYWHQEITDGAKWMWEQTVLVRGE
jgi:hypothetical protein